MLYRFLLVSLLIVLFQEQINAQTWAWGRTCVLPANQTAVAAGITADAQGYVYATGNFNSPTAAFGSTTLNNNSSIASDIYVVRYDPFGGVSWAKNFGGSNYDEGYAICTDRFGYIYVAGAFNSPNISFGTYTLSNLGGDDFYVVKMNSLGNVIWAKSAGGSGNDVASGICADRQGNVILTGNFDSPYISFGSSNLGNTSGTTTPFIAKFDSVGNMIWARCATGNGGLHGNYGAGICADTSSNYYVTGGFSYPFIHFGSDSVGNNGVTNLYIVKYDSSGTEQWLKAAGGVNDDAATGISTDRFCNLVITGSFNSPSITFGTQVLNNAGNSDLFVAKYNSAGAPLWAYGWGGPGVEQGNSVSSDVNGFAYVTGTFGSNNFNLGNAVLTNNGVQNMFMAELNWGGQVLWAQSAGGSATDIGTSVYADVLGNAYSAGYFTSPSIVIGPSSLFYNGNTNPYAAKISGMTGIKSLEGENPVVSYPNPSEGMTTFHFDKIPSTETEFKLYDGYGRLSKTEMLGSVKEFVLDARDLPSGIYFYNLQDPKEHLLAKGKLVFTH